MNPTIVLASSSPRRKEIFQMLGLTFEIAATNADETVGQPLPPQELVQVLAQRKARAAAAQAGCKGKIVVGADTVVSHQGNIFGKPRSEEEAFHMLSALSGTIHQVYTGVCTLLPNGTEDLFYEATDVTFFPLTADEIRGYIHRENPMDKAGAYGIQGKAALFVEKIDGDFYNVVGFPAARFMRRLGASLFKK